MSTTQDFQSWRNNRGQSISQKVKRWRDNPVGAVVRLIEFAYFSSPLNHLLHGDIDEVAKLNANCVVHADGVIVLQGVRTAPGTGLIAVPSGHVITPFIDPRFFLSGQQWNEIRAVLRGPATAHAGRITVVPRAEYFYHFMVETVPLLVAARERDANVSVVTVPGQPAFVGQLLEMLDISWSVADVRVLVVDELALLPRTAPSIAIVGQTLIRSAHINLGPAGRRLFVSQSGGARHDAELEAALFGIVSPYGFELVRPGELQMQAQIALFASADAVVGIHGGALTNLMFARPGAQVLEVFTHAYRTLVFERLCTALGHAYAASESEEAPTLLREWLHKLGPIAEQPVSD